MEREIFIVYAHIVGSDGTMYAPLDGYPKAFDSRQYDGNVEAAKLAAEAEYYDVLSKMCKRTDRQLQTAIMMNSNGFLLLAKAIGKIPDDPEINDN